MGKVLRIYPGTADVETFMRQVVTQMVEDGDEPDGLAIIIKQKRGNWRVGYCNLDFAGKMEAMSHIHIDVIQEMIAENYVTPD